MGTPSQSNNATVAIARMTDQGTLGSPEWLTILPTEIGDPTAVPEYAQHDTIGPDNQYEAGALIKVNAAPKLRMGASAEMLDLALEAAVRCSWSGPISRRTAATRPTSATAVHFVVPSGTVLKLNDLIKVTGALNPANNGIFVVSGAPGATTIPTTPAPAVETFAASANVCIEVCGFQFAAGDCTTTTTAGVTTIGATAKNLTELALVNGQAIQIGSSDAAGYAFATAADNGIAYVTSTPAAGSFTVKPLFGQTFVTDNGAAKTIRILFGQTLRAVPKTHASYIDAFYQIETGVENLGSADATAWVYSENSAVDTFTLSMPANALATLALDMKATDAAKETTQRTNASAPITAKRILPYATSNADCTGRVYLYSAGTALTGFIASMNLVISNQATENPAIGSPSSAFTSFGKIGIKLELTAFLTEGGLIDAPRNNTAISMNFAIRNGDCTYVFHVPEGRIGNGPANFSKNQVVTIDAPVMAIKDGTYATSLIVSKIPGCPALAARAA